MADSKGLIRVSKRNTKEFNAFFYSGSTLDLQNMCCTFGELKFYYNGKHSTLTVFIGGNKYTIEEGNWIVFTGNNSFEIITETDFNKKYVVV